jgi:uncharacterized protein YciI
MQNETDPLTIDPAEPASDATLAAMFESLGRGRNWALWIVNATPTASWPDLAQGVPERFARALRTHLDWLEQLEASGSLLLSGPVDQDLALGTGLTILRASSRERAEAIVADEPMARAGYRTNAVSSWTVNEGSITIRVDLMANAVVV